MPRFMPCARPKAKLPVNLVLVAEGEEEIGSPNFHQVVQRPDIFAALKKAEGIFIPASWQDVERHCRGQSRFQGHHRAGTGCER